MAKNYRTVSILDSIRKKFSAEEVELEPGQAAEFFQDQKQKELEKAESRAEDHVEKTRELIEELEDDLERLQDFEDRQGLDVVEDVAENFYRSRMNLVQKFTPSDDPGKHAEDLEGFIEEFNDVSRKEAEVMKRIRKSSNDLLNPLEKLDSHLEEFQNFLENEYSVVKTREEIDGLLEKKRSIEKEVENLRERRKNIELPKEKIEDTREKIEELEESEEWKRKKELETRLEKLENERKNARRQLSRDISGLERGLKKLVYEIENSDVEFVHDTDKLEQLIDSGFPENPVPELEEALEILEDEDIIGGRQLDKFRSSVESLRDYPGRMETLEELDDKISSVEEQLEQLEVEDKKQSLEKREQSLQRQLEERKNEIKNIESEIERKKEDRARVIEKLEATLNQTLPQEIELTD